jgi:hypothetical protein
MSPPAFAVLGHPNEGKSSVVSTLTENERVRVSRTPGETRRCHRFEIARNGQSALEIFDTPGFENPAATLAWFQAWTGPEEALIPAFIEAHRDRPDFRNDLELLEPLRRRAGILYVADPSRPLREVDRQEMELLRLTGLPRLALLNAKRDNDSFLPAWREALNRRFNLVRDFNAHRATFPERIALLEALAVLDPRSEAALRDLCRDLRQDWEQRLHAAALGIETLLQRVIRHQVRARIHPERPEPEQAAALLDLYQRELRGLEQDARREWRALFQHLDLPGGDGNTLVMEDLFATRVWRLLGLSRRQIAGMAATTAALLGVGVDIAAGGITFGVFTAAGALIGGIAGWIGAPRLGLKKLPLPGGRHLARETLHAGPCHNLPFLFVLLDRSLLYLVRLMNWSHGRRDHEAFLAGFGNDPGFVRSWSDDERAQLARWLAAQRPGPRSPDPAVCSRDLQALLRRVLAQASGIPPRK